jgi:hypothetical protein
MEVLELQRETVDELEKLFMLWKTEEYPYKELIPTVGCSEGCSSSCSGSCAGSCSGSCQGSN